MSSRRLSAATLVGLEELAEAPAATDRDVGASVRRLTLDGDQLVVSLPLTSIRPNPHQELAEAPAATDRDDGASVRRLTLDGDQLVVSLPLTSIRPNPQQELAEAPAATDRDDGASVRRLTLDGDQLVVSLPLTSIRPNPQQPRRTLSEQSLRELADSIAEHRRVLQPILVRPAQPSDPGDAAGFELVAGERRWRASKLAGMQTIRAIVDGVDNARSAAMALTENMARADLTTMEAARGCEALRSSFGGSATRRSPVASVATARRSAISHGCCSCPTAPRHSSRTGACRRDTDASSCAWRITTPATPRRSPRRRLPRPINSLALQSLSESLEPIFGAIGVRIVPRRRRSYRIALDCENYDELAGIVARMPGLPSAAAEEDA